MVPTPRAHPRIRHALDQLRDPFDFQRLLDGLALAPDELPGLLRERRLEGLGL